MNAAGSLTAQRIAAAQEVFALFDAEGTGRVPADALPTMVRELGCSPTEAQLASALIELQAGGEGVDLAAFLVLLAKHFSKATNSEEALLAAFKVLDKSNEGTLLAEEIIYNLLNLGDKLQPEQAAELTETIEAFSDEQKVCHYKKLARHLVQEHVSRNF